MDNIIAAATASKINWVEDYGVEGLDFMEEEPEDIGVVCAMVNEQQEFSEYEYDDNLLPNLETRLYENSPYDEEDSSNNDLMPNLNDQWPDSSSSDDNNSTVQVTYSTPHLN